MRPLASGLSIVLALSWGLTPSARLAAGEADGPAPAAPDPGLERLRSFISELEKPRVVHEADGLKLSAALIPDVLAFEVGRRFLQALAEGKARDAALDQAAKGALELGTLRQLKGQALLRLVLENPAHASAPGGGAQIFTVQEKLAGGVVELVGFARDSLERVGPGKRVALSSLGKPEKLRLASLRVKKFYKRSEKDRGKRDRDLEPILSKPFQALVLEEEPAVARLLFAPEALRQFKGFDLELSDIKRYQGPFQDDTIDLNERRVWEAIRRIRVQLPPPPEGLGVPDELTRLVDEALLR